MSVSKKLKNDSIKENKHFDCKSTSFFGKILVMIPLTVAMLFVILFSDHAEYMPKAGDVDLDGKITYDDITYILYIASGKLTDIPYKTALIADVNGDGKITSADARMLCTESKKESSVIIIEPDAPVNASPADKDSVYVDNSDIISGVVPVVGAISDYNMIGNDRMYIYPDLSQAMAVRNSFVIISFGWGHGVGLSQRGAIALARAGYSYIQIIQHYYGGVAIMKENYPSTVKCSGKNVDTVEMLARIIQMEIAGCTNSNDPLDMQALKAQAVAAYTNMKYSNYTVSGCSYVNSYSQCRDDVKRAAAETAGQFIEYNGHVVYAYYSAVSAGVSATYEQVWGPTSQDMSYLYNAASYYDCNTSDYVRAKVYTPEQMKNYIHAYDPSINLSSDPSEWISILSHDDAVNENIGYVSSMRIGDKTLKNSAGMTFRNYIMEYEVRSPCFAIIYNGKYL